MKTTLMMAITINGMVAGSNDSTPWSNEEFANFEDCIAQHGNIIIGRRTFNLMASDDNFDKLAMCNKVIVVSSTHLPSTSGCTQTPSPKDALDILKQEGFDAAMIGGGTQLNSSFLQEGLVDEIIIDIEPYLFGNGIPLLSQIEGEFKLKLLSQKMLNQNSISLRYRIVK
ncbi:MAG: dihydrofolate reductase [Alphaproteobacteria bacterium]|nr:dihydrofolate reductase [Alphaproteobacteria bacterium]